MCSDGLHAALGLKPNHLPPYIYQMRMLGYPPGHLENARQETSGLAMFGKHGRGVLLACYDECIYLHVAFCLIVNEIFVRCFTCTCKVLLSLSRMANISRSNVYSLCWHTCQLLLHSC